MQDNTVDRDESYKAGKDYDQLSKSAVNNLLIKAGIHGGSALDIGCGTGALGRELRARGFEVTGIDLSAKAIEKAHSLDSESTYIKGDIFSSVLARKFNLITCKYMYAITPDRKALLKKAVTLLADGGCLVVISPSMDALPEENKNIAVETKSVLSQLSKYFESVEHVVVDKDDYYFCRGVIVPSIKSAEPQTQEQAVSAYSKSKPFPIKALFLFNKRMSSFLVVQVVMAVILYFTTLPWSNPYAAGALLLLVGPTWIVASIVTFVLYMRGVYSRASEYGFSNWYKIDMLMLGLVVYPFVLFFITMILCSLLVFLISLLLGLANFLS